MAESQVDGQFVLLAAFLERQQSGETGGITNEQRNHLLGSAAALAELIRSLPAQEEVEPELPENLWEILKGLAEERGLHASSQTTADAVSLLKAEAAGDDGLVKDFMIQQGRTAAQRREARRLIDAFKDRGPEAKPSTKD